MHKQNSGFTLIEMLVVIAIIGILSASVLVALGPSRDKAKDARIISGIKQAQAIVETLYNPTSATPYADINLTDARFTAVVDDVENQGGDLTFSGNETYRLFSQLITHSAADDAVQYYCVDSSGVSITLLAAPSASSGLCQ
jgi:prepilin-type N-terminal cleavage/methylation domain-containing protein